MASFNWFGGTGRFGVARNWDPRGVPGAGDTAVVGGGDVSVTGRQVGAAVALGGTNAGSAPALDLRNASVAGLSMPDDLPQPVYPSVPPGVPAQPTYPSTVSPAEYGTVNVRGHGAVGSLTVGSFANPSRFSNPALFAADTLQVNLLGRATLDTGFDVKDGSTLTISGTVSGGDGSSLNLASSVIEGGTVAINAPLAGQGTITMTAGAVSLEGFGDAGTLELGGPVGAGETVELDAGRLVIDQPLSFAGTLDVGSPANGVTATQDVMLRGLSASSYSFDDATHVLTLWNGDAVADAAQFGGNTVSTDFRMGSPYVAIDVIQQAGGVQLRGDYDFTGPAGTEIPLHTAAA